MLSLALMLTS